jgi:hypothetical protein
MAATLAGKAAETEWFWALDFGTAVLMVDFFC